MSWWNNLGKAGKLIIASAVLAFGCIGCGVLAALLGDGDTQTAVAPAVATEAAGGPTAPPPTPRPTVPPWDELEGFREVATDAQWEAFVESAVIGGQITNWSGYVYEVKVSGNEYRVDIDLEDPTDAFLPTAEIKLKTDNPDAINWFKGTEVVFSGSVKDASYGMGQIHSVELEDAVVEAR